MSIGSVAIKYNIYVLKLQKRDKRNNKYNKLWVRKSKR